MHEKNLIRPAAKFSAHVYDTFPWNYPPSGNGTHNARIARKRRILDKIARASRKVNR